MKTARDCNGLNGIAIQVVRLFTAGTTFRGRHRLVNLVAHRLRRGVEVIEIGGLNVRIDHSLGVCRHMYFGTYETHLIRWIARNLRPGHVAIEPGVNRGFVTGHLLQAVGPTGLVIGLEPSSRCFKMLSEDNALDELTNLKLLHGALGQQEAQAAFCESDRIFSSGYSCLADVGRPRDSREYQIEVHTVDALMARFNVERVHFLKLDIEGSEPAALAGAENALANGSIDAIMVETTLRRDSPGEARLSRKAIAILTTAGYRPHLMTNSGGLRPLELKPETEIRTDIMWTRK
jgi:FkbM family methyltransferase